MATNVFMDDANAPSLLSLAYLGCCTSTDPVFLRTRDLAWSARNPYFCQGRAAVGVGSPHTGRNTIWPMSIIHYALSSHDDTQIATLFALVENHPCRDRLHARSISSGRPKHVYPQLVRLGE